MWRGSALGSSGRSLTPLWPRRVVPPLHNENENNNNNYFHENDYNDCENNCNSDNDNDDSNDKIMPPHRPRHTKVSCPSHTRASPSRVSTTPALTLAPLTLSPLPAPAPQGVSFLSLQRTACFGGASLPHAFVAGELPAAACSVTCPGLSSSMCGGVANASRVRRGRFAVMFSSRKC